LCKSAIDMIDKKRYRIFTAHVIPPPSLNGSTKAILLENFYYKMLTLLPGDVIIIPLPTTIFPTWYINSVINDVISAGKIPWKPFLFEYQKSKIVALEAQQQLSRILLGLKVRSVSLVFIYHLLTVNLIKNGTISTKR